MSKGFNIDLIKSNKITEISNYFGIDKSLAKEILDNVGSNIDDIRHFMKNTDGKLHYHCKRCNKPLKDLNSKLLGYGPVCLEKAKQNIK